MIHFLPALYALKLGAAPFVVGLIPAAHSFPGVFAALPGGKLVDRYGARRVTRWTTSGRILSILIYPWIYVPLWLILPNLISGALATVTVVALHTYVIGVSSGAQRRKEISRFALTGTVGELVGPTLAGLIIDRVDFQMAFLVTAGLCSVSFASALSLPPVGEAEPEAISEGGGQRLGLRGLIADPALQSALCGAMLFALLQGFLRGFLPVLLYGSFSATQIGTLFFAASVASLCGRSIVGWRSEAWSPLRVMPFTAMMTAVPFVFLPFCRDYQWLFALLLLFGVGQGLLSVLSTVLIAESIGPQERGAANGVRLTLMRVGASAGPLLFGPMAQMISIGAAFIAVGAVSLSVALFFLVKQGRGAESALPKDKIKST